MCNPPFFKEQFKQVDDEMSSNSSVRKPSSSNTAQLTESVTEGGEVEFAKKLFYESIALKDKVVVFTLMFGKKSSLLVLKKFVETNDTQAASYTSTEFCQGKTLRWGFAWTFMPSVSLEKAPKIKHLKAKPPLVYNVPAKLTTCEFNIAGITERIKSLLVDDFNISDFDIIRESKKSTEIWIKTNECTWSNQRRKRRQANKSTNASSSDTSSVDGMAVKEDDHKLKRKIDELESDDSQDALPSSQKKPKEVFKPEQVKDEEQYLLHCTLIVKKANKGILLKMDVKERCRSREPMHQVFQLIKNKLT